MINMFLDFTRSSKPLRSLSSCNAALLLNFPSNQYSRQQALLLISVAVSSPPTHYCYPQELQLRDQYLQVANRLVYQKIQPK